MELNFSAKDIYEIEKETGKPLTDVISVLSSEVLVLFVSKGLKVSQEEAFDEIDKDLGESKDTMELYLLILEKLQAKGFLPRVIKLGELKKKMEKLTI